MTIAVNNMKGMVAFYQAVFGLQFTTEKMYDTVLYLTKWDDIIIRFCPADVARNSAKQNKHQIEIRVKNLSATLEKVKKMGGSPIGKVSEIGNLKKIGIYDPDNNSLVLVEK